jgi:hypothetical protein
MSHCLKKISYSFSGKKKQVMVVYFGNVAHQGWAWNKLQGQVFSKLININHAKNGPFQLML